MTFSDPAARPPAPDPELAEASRDGERRLGVVLMGLGRYSELELGPALLQTRRCRLVGVVTRDQEKGRAWARRHGFAERNIWGFDQVHDLAGHPEVDIVYVVTPNGLHAEHVVQAARAGKHVICEKPLANTAAACDTMIAACRAAEVQLAVGYRLQYDPYHAELDRLAREGDFGPLDRISGEHSWVFEQRGWRIEKSLSGGGPLMDVGIYVIHAACRAARARPVAVAARELPKTNPRLFNEVEETIEWTMEFPGGGTCRCASSYARTGAFFRAGGAGGWIHLELAYGYRGIRGSTSRGPLRYGEVPQQARQMDDFASCLLTGRQNPVPGATGRDHAAIIDAIYVSSALEGKRVVVQYF